jgi:hypothetical protein
MKRASGCRAAARVIGTCATAAAVSLAGSTVGSAAERFGLCNYEGPGTPFTIAPGQSTSFVTVMLCQPAAGKNEMATIKFSGLPKGATFTKMVPVDSDASNVTITIKTAPDSPPGGYTAVMSATSPSCTAGYLFSGLPGQFCFARFGITPPPPVITCAKSKGKGCPYVWWFNYANPQPENYITVLGATSGGTDYVWMITGGTQYAQFSDGSTTFDSGKTNTVVVFPTENGDPGMTSGAFATITVTMTNSKGTSTSNPFNITINKPNSLFYVGQDDKPYHEGQIQGYQSLIHYEIRDLFDIPLPNPVPAAEAFGPLIIDDLDSNWPTPDQEGNPQADPKDLMDNIATAVGPHSNPPAMPPSLHPLKPLGTLAIDHWVDNLTVGSTTPGEGSFVETLRFQRFQDHGRHCNIESPPGTPGNNPNPSGC